MTQVATRNKSNSASDLIDGVLDARTETKMILVRKKTVAENDHFTFPTVLQKKIERHSRAVIELVRAQSGDVVVFSRSGLFDCRQQLLIDLRRKACFGRMKV